MYTHTHTHTHTLTWLSQSIFGYFCCYLEYPVATILEVCFSNTKFRKNK